MKRSVGRARASVKSPISLPASFSIGVSTMRPTLPAGGSAADASSQASAPGPRDLVFGEVRDLEQADALAHRPRTRRRHGGSRWSGGRRIVLRLGLRSARTRARCSRPQHVAEHGVARGEPVIDRRGAEAAGRRQLLVGEADAEAPGVVLAHLGVGVGQGGPVAVAGDVHAPDVEAGVAVDHPVGRAPGRRRRPG